jgi:hypothetical protein
MENAQGQCEHGQSKPIGSYFLNHKHTISLTEHNQTAARIGPPELLFG